MGEALGSLEERIAAEEEEEIRRWLSREVWCRGRSVTAEELVEQVSGRPLEPGPFLDYLSAKLEQLASGT